MKKLIRKLLTGKKDGHAYFMGFFFVAFSLTVLIVVIGYYRIGLSTDHMQDVLTVSSLGSLVYDKDEYALTTNYILTNPNHNYQLLTNLIAKNAGLTKINGYQFTGTSTLMDIDATHPCSITRCIFYNCYIDEFGTFHIHYYEYEHGTLKASGIESSATTPNGMPVTTTSVYVKIEYPLKYVMNREDRVMAVKESYVGLSE